MSEWMQLNIVHISDMHFGQNHIFNPPAGGAASPERSLSFSLLKDLREGQFASEHFQPKPMVPSEPGTEQQVRTIFALTGDFNEKCASPEFAASKKFLEGLYNVSVFNHMVTPADIFLIPGNHDLKYAEAEFDDRWYKFTLFYQDHYNARQQYLRRAEAAFNPREEAALTNVFDDSDRGLVVVEINSSAHVQRGTPDERRGQVNEYTTLRKLVNQLRAIDPEKLKKSIRIALIHHHPVVLPAFFEDDNGYDAVLNSEVLLRALRRFGFHLVLHGHKHNPYTYTYDAASAWSAGKVRPMVLLAGGSAGSSELPDEDGARNTYNVIVVKWHPQASQARIHIETTGLYTSDEDGRLPAYEWAWKTLRVDDRLLTASQSLTPVAVKWRDLDASDDVLENKRCEEHRRLRGNYPAIEVFPSLDKNQGYEARVWMEASEKSDYVPPSRVEWGANPRYFPRVQVCERADNPRFTAYFSYYGQFLVRARLVWDDDHEEYAYIFARIPRDSTVDIAPPLA